MRKRTTTEKPAPRLARIAVPPARATKTDRCVVCGGAVAPFSDEDLCWVCRRLKISAWRDVEGQAAMTE